MVGGYRAVAAISAPDDTYWNKGHTPIPITRGERGTHGNDG